MTTYDEKTQELLSYARERVAERSFDAEVIKDLVVLAERLLEEPLPEEEPPTTGVNVHVFFPDGSFERIENVDVVHVVLDNGMCPVAYEPEDEGERRKPGYYDDMGDFHPFDDRRAPRRGW